LDLLNKQKITYSKNISESSCS